jgi:hypothetical protein
MGDLLMVERDRRIAADVAAAARAWEAGPGAGAA